uniref:Uncharacterized protein n=1 Tax=Wuchereria bancrofti TaxID=6293 RepID=A0AAF5RXF2_WUCBA
MMVVDQFENIIIHRSVVVIMKQFSFSPKMNNFLLNVIRITSIYRFKLEITR